ncbi:MAG: hypothetical protein D6731_26140 [Planctomycetota bacterium]|nr:MAG: hypothetical protein D6731_26140 [Planctomycetota bacterium]
MTDPPPRGWSWKVADPAANAELGLLYEPGTWGDLLKAAWAVPLARRVAVDGPPTLLDPFAGAASYPLVPAAAERLRSAPSLGIEDLLDDFLRRGRLPSTGALALAAAGEGARLVVYDVHTARRATWRGLPGVTVAEELRSGEELLAARASEADLVLVDPYDLFERFEALLPAALSAQAPLLLYLYNKAPRGPKALARYRAFRERLTALAGKRCVRVGRAPSDALLPRAYHEVLLVAPPPLARALDPVLGDVTRRLAAAVAEAGAYEAPGETT